MSYSLSFQRSPTGSTSKVHRGHRPERWGKYLSGEALDALIFHNKPIEGETTVAISTTVEIAALWEETLSLANKLGYGNGGLNSRGDVLELMLAEFRSGLVGEQTS